MRKVRRARSRQGRDRCIAPLRRKKDGEINSPLQNRERAGPAGLKRSTTRSGCATKSEKWRADFAIREVGRLRAMANGFGGTSGRGPWRGGDPLSLLCEHPASRFLWLESSGYCNCVSGISPSACCHENWVLAGRNVGSGLPRSARRYRLLGRSMLVPGGARGVLLPHLPSGTSTN